MNDLLKLYPDEIAIIKRLLKQAGKRLIKKTLTKLDAWYIVVNMESRGKDRATDKEPTNFEPLIGLLSDLTEEQENEFKIMRAILWGYPE